MEESALDIGSARDHSEKIDMRSLPKNSTPAELHAKYLADQIHISRILLVSVLVEIFAGFAAMAYAANVSHKLLFLILTSFTVSLTIHKSLSSGKALMLKLFEEVNLRSGSK